MDGRKPKTAEELKRKGTFRKDRHATRVVSPIEGDVPPPPNFDEEHAKLWNAFVADMKPLGLPQKPHLNALELMCKLYVNARKLEAEVTANGWTFKSENGMIKANPAVSMLKQTRDQIMRLHDTFGFNPRASMTMKMQPKEEAKKTSILDLMKGGAKTKTA